MYKLIIALGLAAAGAAPASAHGPDDGRLVDALPTSREVEAMAPAIDRMVGAFLNLDVGPIIDAADPYARRPGYGVPGRTLGALGRRDDPYFDERLRGAIYGGTAQAGRMMESFAAALPAFQRSIEEMQRGLAIAVDDYHRRSDEPYYDPEDEGPWDYPED